MDIKEGEKVPSSAMIAFLPMTTDWSELDLPHLTLVYAGEISKLKTTAFNEMAKDAASVAALTNPFVLQVFSREVFGGWPSDDEEVDVIRFRLTTELAAMRRMVEHWNASEFSKFNPHCTIGPKGSGSKHEIPMTIAFDRIMVAFGPEQLTFWLRR